MSRTEASQFPEYHEIRELQDDMYRYVVVQEFGWKPRANHDFLSLERQMEILHKDLKPETKKPVIGEPYTDHVEAKLVKIYEIDSLILNLGKDDCPFYAKRTIPLFKECKKVIFRNLVHGVNLEWDEDYMNYTADQRRELIKTHRVLENGYTVTLSLEIQLLYLYTRGSS
ncbi:Protein of unknown function [Pyronema omphalodes CBS 100304]|uniref:Uncharacterized protein n=1 Tax=Pyronema omphalodes (strain CBS 100304) TaxID=1076935 RepID=U4LH53_PYROM|nr:Protein of unknown function [Pyronema omphalodes CBS 100304]